MGGSATRADGGSATSQAADLDGVRWAARPWLARGIRLVVLATPLVASVLATRAYASVIDRPSTFVAAALYWLGMLVIATGVVVVVERWTRTLLPLAALFRLSLVFPDRAPSRFRMSLRRGTTTTLRTRLANGELDRADAAEALLGLVAELGAHDRLTRGHSERVRAYADMIGEELGLAPPDRDRLQWAALIHDVGKLTVPAAVLTKPDRPTEHEWEILRRHPAAADSLVAPLRDWLGDWVLAATEHHERWDGRGYPRGLSGERISLAGRIVAVADAYDTMTSVRAYKPGLAPELAREELTRNAGTQFDPTVVRAFLGVGLGRLRGALGPVAWLNEVAWIARIPHGVTATGSTIGTAVATMALAVASPVTSSAEQLVAVERTVPSAVATEPTVDHVLIEDGASLGSDGAVEPHEDEATRTTPDPAEPGTSKTPSTSTTVPPPATTSPQPASRPSTTTLPSVSNPTTSLATTPTTSPPPATTTSTTAPAITTTTTSSPALGGPLVLGGGATTSQAFLDLSGGPSGSGLPNYDTDRDSDPGLMIKKGDGLAETDPSKMQRWSTPLASTTSMRGVPRLDIWVATKDFDTDKDGRFDVGLFDCPADKVACTLLASTSVSFRQADFGGGFGAVSASLPRIDTVVAADRTLVLTLATRNDSEDDLWFAYGTTTYPAALTVD